MKDKIDFEVFKNGSIERDQIKEWLKKDIQGVYILLSEMLYSPEVIDTLTEVFYQRYLKMHKQPEATAEQMDKIQKEANPIMDALAKDGNKIINH